MAIIVQALAGLLNLLIAKAPPGGHTEPAHYQGSTRGVHTEPAH